MMPTKKEKPFAVYLHLDTLLWANGYYSLQDLDDVPNIKRLHFVRDIILGLNDPKTSLKFIF